MFVRALIVEGHACDCVWCEGSVRVAHAGHVACVSRGLRRDGTMRVCWWWRAGMSLTLTLMRRAAQGFLSHNRIGQLKHDAEAWMTFEGDNYVLLQQVGRACCCCYGSVVPH